MIQLTAATPTSDKNITLTTSLVTFWTFLKVNPRKRAKQVFKIPQRTSYVQQDNEHLTDGVTHWALRRCYATF